MGGYAHVFCKSDSAGGAGHVAWGFQVVPSRSKNRMYYFGSYDNNDNDEGGLRVWYDYGPGHVMVDRFRRLDMYDGWKYIWVSSPNLDQAMEMNRRWMNRYYFLFGSNCLNTANDILRAYGAPCMPSTMLPTNWRPEDWFASFQGNKGNFSNL